MDEDLKQNLQKKSTWMRALYMVLFAFIFGIVEILLTAIVAFQFVSSLLTGRTNEQLVKLGQSLSTYLYQITLFLTFNSNDYPYPFTAWPEGAPIITASRKKSAVKKKAKNATKKSSSTEEEKSEDETV
jgi:hypothetical protein